LEFARIAGQHDVAVVSELCIRLTGFHVPELDPDMLLGGDMKPRLVRALLNYGSYIEGLDHGSPSAAEPHPPRYVN
jgi:hypothetical protein